MKKLFPLALLFLAACHTTSKVAPEPIVVTVPVLTPVAMPCVPEDLKPKPEYVDAIEALVGAKDPAERYQLLWAGRMQREARLNELEPIVALCPRGKVK